MSVFCISSANNLKAVLSDAQSATFLTQSAFASLKSKFAHLMTESEWQLLKMAYLYEHKIKSGVESLAERFHTFACPSLQNRQVSVELEF